ncbi:hypothetical protein JYT72_01335 [Crocinitomix catalasitica]|nr:hypothetical protein [Crocinitomix catalasitica]
MEIIIPNGEDTLRIKFLKDTVDFEIFYNNFQIDHSTTSAPQMVKSLNWITSVIIGWYTLVLFVGFFAFENNLDRIIAYPESIFFDPFIIYLNSSTLLILILFSFLRYYLKRWKLNFLKICILLLLADGLYAIVYVFYFGMQYGWDFQLTAGLIIPGSIRALAIYSYLINFKKYQEYCLFISRPRDGTNPETLDL